ncbi:MAG: extracellular solute-binding protein [Leptolyngbyaceae cyanobacterium bins.59]|nr:extracellular solute-binding protein [Leptolyngbyaceae cyanobacterium bins.59]
MKSRNRLRRPPQRSLLHPSRRQFLQASAATLSGMALSGCGWTLAEVRPAPAAPGRTDQLYIYTWSSYIDDKLREEFRAQTGIEVFADVFDSDDTMLAAMQAGKGASYSIIYPSSYGVERLQELKLAMELDKSKLNGLENIPPQFQQAPSDPGNRYSIPISWGTTGFIYNKEMLKEAPTDWGYLWQNKDKLSQRMTLLNDVREVMGGVLKSLGYSYNSQKATEIEAAYKKLVELKPAIASFTSDGWRDQILAGDLWLAMGYSADAFGVIEENPKLGYVIPSSGTSLWSDSMVIPKTAPNVEGAYAWINLMLQPSVISAVCQRLNFAPPNTGAYDQLPLQVRENPILFPPQEVLDKAETIAPVEKSATELYDRYWTKLTSG